MERFKVGIIGAGHIARKMAHSCAIWKGLNRMQSLPVTRKMPKGLPVNGFYAGLRSYEDLADDPEVQLIYIATPHSHHFEQARMCLERVSRSYVKKHLPPMQSRRRR